MSFGTLCLSCDGKLHLPQADFRGVIQDSTVTVSVFGRLLAKGGE
jgi:hypothetical protein